MSQHHHVAFIQSIIESRAEIAKSKGDTGGPTRSLGQHGVANIELAKAAVKFAEKRFNRQQTRFREHNRELSVCTTNS